MAQLSSMIVTNKGKEMLLKTTLDNSIKFTKVVLSEEKQRFEDLEMLENIGENQSVKITNAEMYRNNQIKIDVKVSNEDLTDGYYLKSMGIYAKDKDTEVLFAACVEQSGNCYMESLDKGVSGAFVELYITISNAEKISLEVNPAGVATLQDINRLQTRMTTHINNKENPHSTTKVHIGLSNVENTADKDKIVASAAKLTTARKINGIPFDGTDNINVPTQILRLTDEDLNTLMPWEYTNYYFAAGGNNVVNKPDNEDNFGLIVIRSGGDYYMQLLFGMKTYVRQGNRSKWTSWLELYSTQNPPYAKDIIVDYQNQFVTTSEKTSWSSKTDSATVENMINDALLNKIYPIGCVYTSTVPTSPNTLFGGTWEQITDCFLAAVGLSIKTGKNEGKRSITLTTENLPSHTHTLNHTHTTPSTGISASGSHIHNLKFQSDNAIGGNMRRVVNNGDAGTLQANSYDGEHTHTVPSMTTNSISTTSTGSVGSGQAIDVTPPYYGVYAWKRIS